MEEYTEILTVPVLVVDDIKANREIVGYYLKEEGYDVVSFESGDQIYNYINDKKKDIPILVVTDVLMPGVDGLTLLKKLNKISKNIYAIVITGHGGVNDLKEAFDAGAIDFIRKPINKIELVSRVNNVVRIIRSEEMLKRISGLDFLTGIHNRRYFFEVAEKEISRSSRYKNPLSFVIADIDNFKEINDTYGHQAGDEVLKLLCRVLEGTLRKNDIFCRFGGDEFMLLLIQTSISGAKEVAERIRCDVEKLSLKYDNRIIKFTISLGATEFLEGENENINDIIKKADSALYKTKSSGRNIVKYS